MQDPPIGHPSDRRGRPPSTYRSARRFTAGLGVLVLICAAAYVTTLPLGGAPTAAGAAGAVGQPAPDFVSAGTEGKPLLADLDGNPIRLHDFAGRPLWIVFWATWCTPCQQEASDIRASYHAHHDEDLAVLAIDIQEPTAAVRKYAQGHDLDYAIGLDPTAAVKALYGGFGLPFHFFVDGDGMIRDRYLGQMTRELMEEHLQAILGPEARSWPAGATWREAP